MFCDFVNYRRNTGTSESYIYINSGVVDNNKNFVDYKMKKIVLFFLMMLPVAVFGQKDVTTFLGIPVDGTKTEVVQKLKAKGFVYNANLETYEGEFNGQDVLLQVLTNNNRVWRIALMTKNAVSESDIKINFNNLVHQFESNTRYRPYSAEQIIPEDEKLSYEILVHKKRYEATFYQKEKELSDEEREKEFQEYLHKQYSEGELKDSTRNIGGYGDRFVFEFQRSKMKTVWFMIEETSYNRYHILLFYDNKYNKANGEDL